MDGVLIIKGPDIKKNTQIRGANITDITPTILHIFGIPLPKDVDGRVLREIFKPCNVDAKRKPPYLKLYQKEVIKRRVGELKAAGRI
jgi:arylsulfatase A-like enzyme